ncbi:MAG: glycosyltransferase family protein, partial [Polyangiaceae bacterium]
MRLFQNSTISPSYRTRLYRLSRAARTFHERLAVFLDDRYGASHFLQPVLEQHPEAFFTNGDDPLLQLAWGREHGMRAGESLPAILLAQIEEHCAEVFYTLDPIHYGGSFVRRLPGCVKHSVCWRAAPSPGIDLTGFDLLVCNFPGILEGWRAEGRRAAYFTPAHDPAMEGAGTGDRPVDVVFVGGYSRHHRNRAAVIEAVAGLASRYEVQLCLDRSRMTRLAETPLGMFPPLRRHRRPRAVRVHSSGPVFGRALYELVSRSKIVLNGAIDMSGEDRGNMRCFEALGCGALLLSDRGRYPEGFTPGENMITYGTAQDAADQVVRHLADQETSRRIAAAGAEMIRSKYSKAAQWKNFRELIE